MSRVMAAHQPNFLPYLRFFDKMMQSDVFVIRDECQFVERDWHNRNRIRISGPKGFNFVRVPVPKEQQDLKDVMIRNEVMDKGRYWNVNLLIQVKSNYETTPYFKQYFTGLQEIFMNGHQRLLDLNMQIIKYLCDCFDIHTEIVLASELNGYKKSYEPNRDLVGIAKATHADVYLSGPGGKSYLNLVPFQENGIVVKFQDFKHPTYQQRFSGFLPDMASIDALFCAGPAIIKDKYF